MKEVIHSKVIPECQFINLMAKWIDTAVIAQVIHNLLVEHSYDITFENGKMVWLVELENLFNDLQSSLFISNATGGNDE